MYLFVAADGPRVEKAGEEARCHATRQVVENGINWDCQVKTLYQYENLGCGKAVSTAINWFFSYVEAGIILEDDCLADPTFFDFCAQLLNKYQDRPEIMHIGGANFQPENKKRKHSYYFSNYLHIWGWATWKRAWDMYTFDIPKNFDDDFQHQLKSRFPCKEERNYWRNTFAQMSKHEIDTWDLQWSYSVYQHSGIAITPAVNLVSNIGFGADATHTTQAEAITANLPAKTMANIIHPKNIRIDRNADRYTYDQLFRHGNTRFNRLKFKLGKKLPIVKEVYLKLKKQKRQIQ